MTRLAAVLVSGLCGGLAFTGAEPAASAYSDGGGPHCPVEFEGTFVEVRVLEGPGDPAGQTLWKEDAALYLDEQGNAGFSVGFNWLSFELSQDESE